MAVKTNLKDIGWMYHSPSKKSDADEIRVPPTSQIPLLGNSPEDFLPPEQDKNQHYYKDTDTAYIILSKQGGRRDLLKHDETVHQTKTKQKQQQGQFNRCDWFYLEDQHLANQQEQNNDDDYQPCLPEYMVHESWNPTSKPVQVHYGKGERGRPPFATETIPQPQRFDKRKGLPENRKHGYGIRAEKSKESDQHKKPTGKIAVNVQPTSESELRQKARRGGGFQDPNECKDVPAMEKLLAMGYAQDWHQKHDQYENAKSDAARKQAEKLHALQQRLTHQETKPHQNTVETDDRTGQQQLPPWRPSGKGTNFQ